MSSLPILNFLYLLFLVLEEYASNTLIFLYSVFFKLVGEAFFKPFEYDVGSDDKQSDKQNTVGDVFVIVQNGVICRAKEVTKQYEPRCFYNNNRRYRVEEFFERHMG